MKVVIVGAGSIGLLLGSYFAEMGHDLYMLTRREAQATSLLTKGITRIMPDNQEIKVSVQATTQVQHLPKEALWVFAVKFHQLEDTKNIIQYTTIHTPLLFVQNGLGHLRWMKQLKNKQLYIGTIEHGAMKQNDTTVFHRGIGSLNLAPLTSETAQVDFFSKVSPIPSFPIKWGNDAHFIALRKTILNACINPLTALLQVKNGELVNNVNAAHLLQKVYEEIMYVFPEMQPYLSLEDVRQLCEKTGENHSSMLQDIRQNKKTEIETIVGAILQFANERNKETPTLATLFRLICALEESGVKLE